MTDPILCMLSQPVVLDTAIPIVYIGTLTEVTETVFVLIEADVHDCRHGHADKEAYVATARRDGVAMNRQEIVVMRSVVMSMSRLADIVDG